MDISAFLAENEENIKRDIKRLVGIRSVKSAPEPGAPYGAGVRAAQLEAMRICEELGLHAVDCGGRFAYAHYGREDRFIGIIAHVDVVPEGGGWDTPAFDCTERDGYLVGRGTGDDKGPFVLAAYAVKYLIESGAALRYGIRLLIGLDEECGMSDIVYYKAHYPQPVFTFTPDSDFPVGHGEKGILSAELISPPVGPGAVRTMSGGVASNVVADSARATVRAGVLGTLRAAAARTKAVGICVGKTPEGALVEAAGRAAHAGTPEGGVSAIHRLASFLCESGVLEPAEQAAMTFIRSATAEYDGSFFGIDAADGRFTPNTLIAGLVEKRADRFVLNVNSRYNTAIDPQEVARRIGETAEKSGFSVHSLDNSAPFYLSPDHPAVQTLCGVYAEVTGGDARPYVMSGGTYARRMDNAVSYGIEFPGDRHPDWAGSAHMKNEALSIRRAMQSCEIFIRTLQRLQTIDLEPRR